MSASARGPSNRPSDPHHAVCYLSHKGGGLSMSIHACKRSLLAIYNVLTQGRARAVQKGGSNPQTPGQITP